MSRIPQKKNQGNQQNEAFVECIMAFAKNLKESD